MNNWLNALTTVVTAFAISFGVSILAALLLRFYLHLVGVVRIVALWFRNPQEMALRGSQIAQEVEQAVLDDAEKIKQGALYRIVQWIASPSLFVLRLLRCFRREEEECCREERERISTQNEPLFLLIDKKQLYVPFVQSCKGNSIMKALTENQRQTCILDPENPTETARLMLQDRMLTEGMHGVFPEQANLDNIHEILDVGCGPGGWALDVAHIYPDRRVVGIDSNATVIAYAQAQATAQRLSNTTFLVMDALQPLNFAEAPFDLVNVRLAVSFVPSAQWMTFLRHCLRVLRPGGILRLTEAEVVDLTTSPAVEKMHSWGIQALHRRGYGFSSDGSHLGMTPILDGLLREVGCENIQSKQHVLDFSSGTALYESQYQNYMVWPQLLKSVLMASLSITEEEFDQTYQQMLEEMQQPQFRGLWSLLTVWGEKTRVSH